MSKASVLFICVCAVGLAGCRQQMHRIFYQSPLSGGAVDHGNVILAAEFGTDQTTPTASRPADAPASQPADGRGYTAPGGVTRQMSFLAVLATSAVMATPGESGGLEAAQSAVGRPGLAASVQAGGPGGTVGVQSVGRRGLQQGAPLGGGLNVNIFAPRTNPLSARCQELVGAGFFGDVAACRAQFDR